MIDVVDGGEGIVVFTEAFVRHHKFLLYLNGDEFLVEIFLVFSRWKLVLNHLFVVNLLVVSVIQILHYNLCLKHFRKF